MADLPGWYPPGQVCCPPDLPTYLKNICELKPIVGVPNNAEVMDIHSVMHAANRVSGVPGMHDAVLFMGLADHLFSVQMARYRSKHSLVTFPSDATYTPSALPAHVTVALEPVTGAPSNEEVMKAQDAVRSYQHFSHVPSMFDPLVNMELSQHLFDIQMARYMRAAGETVPNLAPQTATRHGTTERTLNEAYEPATQTNNVGTGANAAEIHQTPQPVSALHLNELIHRSDQLAERFNQLLERFNQLMEQCAQPADRSNSQTLAERFNQVLERFACILEPMHKPTQPDQLAERFNQLLDQFNKLTEHSKGPAQTANKLLERANQIAERANQLVEQAQKPVGQFGDQLRNINKVLVGIQHAIIRNHKGNTISALDCLVNEKGETPGLSQVTCFTDFQWFKKNHSGNNDRRLRILIDGVSQEVFIPDEYMGRFLHFYDIGEGLYEGEMHSVCKGKAGIARTRIRDYLSSQLG
ncbi:unnamed protein product [Rhizoctonia solani]|uniref:Laminin domain protein n=1 Tax=Rhizoctonia solani TaxID=456999 RepID=A0A8H3E1G3_9AGAM|nr:unnamed protein product [Rhizoctonia solani]